MPGFLEHVIGSGGAGQTYMIGRREPLPRGTQPVHMASLALVLEADPDVTVLEVKGPRDDPTRIIVAMNEVTAAKYQAQFGARLIIEKDEPLTPS